MRVLLALALVALWLLVAPAPTARADVCPYPGVGVGAHIFIGYGGFCDYPTEINGSHMHCEIGGAGLGGGAAIAGDMGAISGGLLGVGGASCTWRCPDNTMAPAPNPPGAWKNYMVVMESTNWCFIAGHMTPAGHWSAPVLPTEGVPPEGFVPPPGSPQQRPQN